MQDQNINKSTTGPEESVVGGITIEQALEKVGAEYNRYQIISFILFSFQWLIAGMILNSAVFLFKSPSVDCSSDVECQAVCTNSDAFTLSTKCSNYICDQSSSLWSDYLYGESIVMFFEPPLVCSRTSIANTLEAMVFIGSLVGFFLLSFIADNYGRRLGLAIAWMSASVGTLLLLFSQEVIMMAAGLLLMGFGVNPAITIHFSIINEQTGKIADSIKLRFRDQQNIGVQLFFPIGSILFCGIGYFFPHWRTATLIIAIPTCILNLTSLFIQETPKFAYQKNKKWATTILNKIATINGKPKITEEEIQQVHHDDAQSKRLYSPIDLIKFSSIRMKFLMGLIMFFTMQIMYYGINFALETIGINVYQDFLIVSGAEFLALAISDSFVSKYSRKKVVGFGMMISGVLQMIYYFLKIPNDCDLCSVAIAQVVLAAVNRFIISFAWAFLYVYASEMFPTVVRSLALGYISASGTIGSVVCPFIVTFSQDVLNLNPFVVLGFLGILGALSTTPLNDTFGVELSDDIAEESQGYTEPVKTLVYDSSQKLLGDQE